MKPLRIRKVKNNGKTKYCLDLRAIGKGRLFFSDEKDANSKLKDYKIEWENFGPRAFDLSAEDRTQFQAAKERLDKLSATIAEAVEFYIRHGQKRGGTWCSAPLGPMKRAWRSWTGP